jgi:L-alanine-DL-glutamate epimerase-like enolase superfamily enzyme
VRRADNVLVRIETDNGVIGWWEAASAPVMTARRSRASYPQCLTAVLLGRDVADIEGALAAMDGNARVPCHTLLRYMIAE